MNTKYRLVAVGAAACAAMGATIPGAFAATPAPSGARLATIKANAASAISLRLTDVNKAIPAVEGNRYVTVADRATLLDTLQHDVSGLTALGQKIAADTTAKQAGADASTIYTGYRIFALALPQVRYAEAADDLQGTVLPKLADAQGRLSALLAGADSSKDTPAVQAAMADLASRIAGAQQAIDGTSTTVLAYTPSQWDSNHGLLDGPRQNVENARTDVKAARADVASVLGTLK